eukprot:SAG31_NODE_3746_length_3928_cov_4.375555_3_plen_112_part_00
MALASAILELATQDDTFSISALHLAIKVPYFSNSEHKNEKVTSYLLPLIFEANRTLQMLLVTVVPFLFHLPPLFLPRIGMHHLKDDTFSISALHLAIKVPYFSNSGHKNEK